MRGIMGGIWRVYLFRISVTLREWMESVFSNILRMLMNMCLRRFLRCRSCVGIEDFEDVEDVTSDVKT